MGTDKNPEQAPAAVAAIGSEASSEAGEKVDCLHQQGGLRDGENDGENAASKLCQVDKPASRVDWVVYQEIVHWEKRGSACPPSYLRSLIPPLTSLAVLALTMKPAISRWPLACFGEASVCFVWPEHFIFSPRNAQTLPLFSLTVRAADPKLNLNQAATPEILC